VMDKKVSGFGYCTQYGHKDVNIYKTEDGQYYVEIGVLRSSKFSSLDDIETLWDRVREVEQDLHLIYHA